MMKFSNEISNGQIVNFCGIKFRVLNVLDQDTNFAVLQVQKVNDLARSVISFKLEKTSQWLSRSEKMIIC